MLAWLVIVVLGCWRFVHSPAGRVLACIRQNEMRARFLGYRVWVFKFCVFVLSTAIAGLAGALFAMAQQSAYPNVMSLHQSGFVVMMVLVGGGLASFWGPLVGAAFFILARDLLGAYTETWLLWYGLVFMAIVLWKPEGLAGIGRSLADRVRALTMALFEARNLHKRFGDRVVLEDVSLAFETGTTTGIMGPNGAGKTTCFNVLTGHFAPDRGRVVMDGADITGLAPHAITRLGVARSFQAINLFDQETAQDNVVIALPRTRARARDAWRDLARDTAAQDEAAMLLEPRRLERPRADARARPVVRRTPSARDRARAGDETADPVPRRADVGARRGRHGAARRPRRRAQAALHDRDHRARHAFPVRARRPHPRDPLGPGDRTRHAGRAPRQRVGAPLDARERMMLAIDAIDAYYGETQVLFGVSLDVAAGEVVALLGPNGAGKTTTLRAVLGLTPARTGTDHVRRTRRHALADASSRAPRACRGCRTTAACSRR